MEDSGLAVTRTHRGAGHISPNWLVRPHRWGKLWPGVASWTPTGVRVKAGSHFVYNLTLKGEFIG